MPIVRPVVHVGEDALDHLVRFAGERNLRRLALIADPITHRVLGERVEGMLRGAGCDVLTVVLRGDEIVVDERYIVQVLLQLDRAERVFVGVGSGTITDITRFLANRLRADFISVPTAPSVDAYSSPVTPMVVEGIKINGPGHLPLGIFADIETLCAAPRPMISAGFGDVIAKYTSLADWKLGRLLWADPYDERVLGLFTNALNVAVESCDAIGAGSREGIAALTHALVEAGLGMAEFGMSLPASGSEHFISHFWEMRLLMEGRKALLHGAKVGVGTVIAAGYWQEVGALSADEAARRLRAQPMPDPEQERRLIRETWAAAANLVITEQQRFLSMDEQGYAELVERIIANWGEVQALAAEVPSPEHIAGLLRCVGGPVEYGDLGLTERDYRDAVASAFHLRNRLPISRLHRMLGLR
jgi:glycerol-1-phosphate dehydrogenase [NAD(P)+]